MSKRMQATNFEVDPSGAPRITIDNLPKNGLKGDKGEDFNAKKIEELESRIVALEKVIKK